jgi:Kdo2-lipid IVA lauroyltransferase/acyltransferase
MSRLIYIFILKPLSLLPLEKLYYLSNFIFFLIYYLFGYRKKVVMDNLRRSFPEKDENEIHQLAKKFYVHLADLVVESIKLFSISKEEIISRYKFINPELLDRYYDQKKSLIIAGSHYNNWEMAAVGLNTQMKHQAAGIYTPMTNPYFERIFRKSRGKYGIVLVRKNEVKEFFNAYRDQLTATVFAVDQSPSLHTKRVYWTNFLNQDTPVMFGTEKYAKSLNFPVLFVSVTKVRRGFYEVFFEVLVEDPKSCKYGEITELHTRYLEKIINKNPEYWLWTHKRWKRKRSDFQPD